MHKSLRFPLFILIAWIFAFIYEAVPRIILKNKGIEQLWDTGNLWFLLFLAWYGAWFTLYYFIFINRNIKYPVFFGILYGLIFETWYFKKMDNAFSFIVFVLLYLGMFYFPFRIFKSIYGRDKANAAEILIVSSTQVLLLALLLAISFLG